MSGWDSMEVRRATITEDAAIVELSERVQAALVASGSLQRIGPIPHETVVAHITAGTAHVLVRSTRVIGSIFVAPESAETRPKFQRWELADMGHSRWFLEKFMLAPEEQGRQLGYGFIAHVKEAVAAQDPHATIALDCWAGNQKLLAFYTRAGFTLHGIYPDAGFEVAIFTWRITQ